MNKTLPPLTIGDIQTAYLFLVKHYEFRYNPTICMIEIFENKTIHCPCATNASIRKDFVPLDKPILYTLSCYFKNDLRINISTKSIVKLIKLHLGIWNDFVRINQVYFTKPPQKR
jgi:hypothetical protein